MVSPRGRTRNPKGFLCPDNLARVRFPPEAACVAESLGFCQIGLPPPEFPGHELVLRNVQGAANILLQALLFEDRNPDAANVSDLAIGPHDALGGIEGRSFRRESLDEIRHGLAILWVDTIQIFLNSRRFAVR